VATGLYSPRLEPVELRRQVGGDEVAQLVQQERERHAVDVAGRRQARRVHVGVSVDPDDAELGRAAGPSVPRHRADREAVVAAEHDALAAGAHRPLHGVRDLPQTTHPAAAALTTSPLGVVYRMTYVYLCHLFLYCVFFFFFLY